MLIRILLHKHILSNIYRLLAWTDQTQHTLESVASTGEQREVITTQNGRCGPGPLTADYSTHKIYWLDYCSYTIKAMTMDTHEILNIAVGQTTEVTPASTGIVSFRGSVYWAKLKNLYHFDGNETTTYTLNIDGTSSVTAMQIVHPSRQPIGRPTKFTVSVYIIVNCSLRMFCTRTLYFSSSFYGP